MVFAIIIVAFFIYFCNIHHPLIEVGDFCCSLVKNCGYDYIFLYSVYPNIQDKDRLFSHAFSLLNPTGKIIIAHLESKEDINKIHSKNPLFKDHYLPEVEVTEKIMKKYFKVDLKIDNDEMYYISGTKI